MTDGPSASELEELAGKEGIELEEGEATELLPVVLSLLSAAREADRIELPLSRCDTTGRRPGHRPTAAEDPLNAFVRRCHVQGEGQGLLAGRTAGVKDNISVAGIPTSNGSRLPSWTPTQDAAVVERLLRAGCAISGKLNMDDFGTGGTGETSAFGPTRNPIDPARSAGGSSGGSGAAVRAGAVDVALAVDQGGSGRIPAAFCGVVAIKATHGLVPSLGVTHFDHTIDFVTPIARTVRDAALVLEAIAGADPRDPQWVRGEILTTAYSDAEQQDVSRLSVAIIEESCNPSVCEPAVLEGVSRSAAALGAAGARVERISLPIWSSALAVFQPYIACLAANMVRSDGAGYGHLGELDPAGIEAFHRARRAESAVLPKQMKCWMIADRYLTELHGNAAYARLHNLRLHLRDDIARALSEHDLLLTPTVPMTAPLLPVEPAGFGEVAARTSGALCFNTAPLNLSGHPALSLPSGTDEAGLPTAVQLVAGRFAEAAAFTAAFELERVLGPFVPG